MRELTERELETIVRTIDKARAEELNKGNWWKSYHVEASFKVGKTWKHYGDVALAMHQFRDNKAYLKTVGGEDYIYCGTDRYHIDDEIKALFN